MNLTWNQLDVLQRICTGQLRGRAPGNRTVASLLKRELIVPDTRTVFGRPPPLGIRGVTRTSTVAVYSLTPKGLEAYTKHLESRRSSALKRVEQEYRATLARARGATKQGAAPNEQPPVEATAPS